MRVDRKSTVLGLRGKKNRSIKEMIREVIENGQEMRVVDSESTNPDIS
jgi:hypothetical protein